MKGSGGSDCERQFSMVESQEHWAPQQQCLCGEWPNGEAGNRWCISHFKELGVSPRAQSILLKTEPAGYVTTLRSEKDET